MRKKKSNDRLLDAIHETAQDLHDFGFIDKRAMARYDILCVASVPDYTPEQIREIRARYRISQTAFASILNTSVSAVRKWEIGEKHPSALALKLINILDRKGIEAFV